MSQTTAPIIPASLEWHTDELGNCVPYATTFGDVYYSIADGLSESRYVFIEHNQLPKRFEALFSHSSLERQHTFTIAELGFGTGLNFLLTWMLWDDTKQQNSNYENTKSSITYSSHPTLNNLSNDSLKNLSKTSATSIDNLTQFSPRLHFITTEKHPLILDDLVRSLNSWEKQEPKLSPYIDKLIKNYPTLVAGCHRLHLAQDVVFDIWLGDALQSLNQLETRFGASVDAWFLDGFAPSTNESMWSNNIFTQIRRLSQVNTSAATFSCAGVVKRGLQEVGFNVQKVAGYGRKRHMLTAQILKLDEKLSDKTLVNQPLPNQIAVSSAIANQNTPHQHNIPSLKASTHQVAIIGSGIAGLMSAYALAKRGLKVLLIDKTSVLAGASGNPRALLAPKMTPITHVAEHLHSISYLYSQRLYRSLNLDTEYIKDNRSSTGSYNKADSLVNVFENTGTLDLLIKANVDMDHIADYPDDMATTLPIDNAKELSGIHNQEITDNLYLPQAGLVNPNALAHKIMAHPLITYAVHEVVKLQSDIGSKQVHLICANDQHLVCDVVIIAAGYESCLLDERIFDFRKIRGQLSWFTPSKQQLENLPKVPLKYGGYCALFLPKPQDDTLNPVVPNQPTFLLGASFKRNKVDTSIKVNEHESNREKLVDAVREFDDILPKEVDNWHARVGIRAQTPDYHPCVGQIDNDGLIWTISGMGSKGYAFAPLCAEVLADILTGEFMPIPSAMIEKLSPTRARLKTPLQS